MLARSPVTTPRVFGSFCRTASAFCALRACNNTWWPFSMSRSAAINPIPSVDPVIKIFFIIKGIRIYGMFAYRCLDDRNYTTINAILMPRAKISRKSTVVDMTAMCDVAFLLLSFFILVARPKPPGALNVITPTSVSSTHMSEKNVVLITIDKDAKVYLSVSEANVNEKKAIIDAINTSKGLHLTDAELVDWVRAAVDAFQGTHMNLMVKGDQASKYPAFQGIIIALKKNEQFKFQLVTDPVQPPHGTELARERGI